MPEVVLRIAGDNVSAIRSVRALVSELQGVKIETEQIGGASKTSSATIAETARLNVTRAIEQRDALRLIADEYGTITKAAAAGSEEAKIANNLWQESVAKLAAEYDAVGVAAKRASAESVAASARAREESGLARGFASRSFGLSAFAGGAFIVGAAAGLITKKALDESQRAQESQAQLQNALTRTGQSWDQQGASIERYLVRAEKASAFDRIDLRTSLGLLVRTTGDTAKAQDLLSQATDVARGRHISLDTAVRLVTRAYQGSVGSLARLGIHVDAVTTSQDRLREAHVKTTPEMVKQAKEIDRQATATKALAVLNDRYSGAAVAHARTLAGHEEALGNAFTDVAVAIGKAVTPALSRLFEWMARTIEAATKSKTVHEVLHDTFKVLGDIIAAVVTDLRLLWDAGSKIVDFIRHHLIAEIVALGYVVVTTMQLILASMPWTAILAAAVIAVTEIVRHWSTVKRWFGDFWGWLKGISAATWDAMKGVAYGAVYAILQYATAAIRGILELASHLPFVGGKARAALDSINSYLDTWKQKSMGEFSAAGRDLGNAFGQSYQDAVAAHIRNTKGYLVPGAGADAASRRGVDRGSSSASQGGYNPFDGRGGGFVPGGATFKIGRVDQGQDFQTDPGGPIIAPGDGVCTGVHSDPGGFGPDYPTVHFTSGPYKGHTMYIGHTHSALRMGERFRRGQVIAHTGFSGVGNATVPGWAEIGYWGPSGPIAGFTIGGGSHAGRPQTSGPTQAQLNQETRNAAPSSTPATPAYSGPTGDALLPAALVRRARRFAAAAAHDLSAAGSSSGSDVAAFYDKAVEDMRREEAVLRQEVRSLDRKLKGSSGGRRKAIEAEIAKVEGQIASVHSAVRSALGQEENALQSAVSTLQSTVSSSFASVQQAIIARFQANTQAAIDAVGKRFFQGAQTPQEAAYAAAQATDQAQSLQDALAQATATGDPAQIAAAKHQIALFNLEAAATASRTKADQDYAAAVAKIQKEREDAEEHLTVALDKFGSDLSDGSATIADLQPLLNKYGVQVSDLSSSSFIFKTNLDSLSDSVKELDSALVDLADLVSQITGKPVHHPRHHHHRGASGGGGSTGGGGGATDGSPNSPPPAFASGGILPGPMIGPEDTLTARVSTGEGVLSRDEMRMLLTAAIGRSGSVAPSVLRGSPIYVLGATEHEVGRALARIITPAQDRSVGFKNY